MPAAQSRSEHVLDLARDLLDDVELGRLDAEKLILKSSRLARLAGSSEVQEWLSMELGGYYNSDLSKRYMSLTGRWLDRDKGTGYWGPLAEQEASVTAETARLAVMRLPDSATPLVVNAVMKDMALVSRNIAKFSGIRSRVLAQLHKFVSDVYYQKEFETRSESIFERYKSAVDTLIAKHCGDVLQKLPAVMDRLAEGDDESISQSLSTCRRIIQSFADSIFPPTSNTIEIDGNTLSLDANKVKNRINAYIHERTTSQSRRKRFQQNLSNLFDRASGGVHDSVTAEEAHSLFLNTYLLLGEVLHLPDAPSVAAQNHPDGAENSSADNADANDSGASFA